MQVETSLLNAQRPVLPIPPTSARRSAPSRAIAKDAEIFAEGDDAESFYRVVSGVVRTYKTLSDGRRQIDAFHLPGDFFGLESGDEHRFTAEAVGDVTVTAYRRCALEALAMQDTELAKQATAAMMRALERAQDHMLLLGRKCAVEKVASFLLGLAERMSRSGDIELPMSRIDVADHLGLTIETVSRSLTHLERAGVIALPAHRRSIQLRNRAALARLNS
ncbi:helix-turn-helix domain-containing protein [Chelatococcus sambhunathii]|uniref:Helix-turn-helix domain-containing protein n=2 Tax=Chelatococcus sambhunathii TaxID=363953 RepID=A0ABU1DGQ5_9HYPH|nr:helix-turn-helix domain-containing protein [Chelatococcus sambhunathii]